MSEPGLDRHEWETEWEQLEPDLEDSPSEALNELDEEYRVPVVLYDVLGCSYSEIAELTGVPEGTVKSRIFRGRSRLAERLGTAAGSN